MLSTWEALGWTMLHFLWAGALVGLLARVVLWAVRRRSVQLRYAAALAAFAVLAFTPALLFALRMAEDAPATVRRPAIEIREMDQPARVASGPIFDKQADAHARLSETDDHQGPHEQKSLDATSGPVARSNSIASLSASDELPRVIGRCYVLALDVLPWIWVCGFPLASAWILFGVTGAERLRRRCRPLENEEWLALCRRLVQELGLRVPVQFAVCDRLAVPLLIGILRPLVLLPASAVSGYSPEQVEMIVLHELAHVRRWDNLVNLLQRLVEAVLFFHPSVWWLSRRVRLEREHCCDAVVLAHAHAPQRYAELLAKIALPGAFPEVFPKGARAGAIGVSAGEQLVARIRHILNQENETMKVSRSLMMTVLACFVGLICVAIAWPNLKPSAIASAKEELLRNPRFQNKELPLATDRDVRPDVVATLVKTTAPGSQHASNDYASAETQTGKNRDVDAPAPQAKTPAPMLEPPKETALEALDRTKVMSFQFRNSPWTTVLSQFAAETHLELRMQVVPEGVFSRWDAGRYTPSQALAVLNGELARTGCQLKLEGTVLLVCAITPPAPNLGQPQPAAAPEEKGHLQFEGSSFKQWQSILMTELDPKMRAKALSALGRFGAFGYEDEASAAIAKFLSKARLIRTDEEDQKVERAAREAFNRIGPQSLKSTVKLLKDKSPEVRLLATEITGSLMWNEPNPQPSAVEAMIETTTDPEEAVRRAALTALAPTFGPKKKSDRSVVGAAVTKRLQDDSPGIRAQAAQILGGAGPSAAEAVPALLAALKDPRNEETDILRFGINGSVIDALVQYGAAPAILVPALVELLPRAQADVRTLQRITLTLGRLKSAAAPAVPALIDALKRADYTEFQGVGELSGLQSELQHEAVRMTAQALAEIGPTTDSPLARTVLQEKLSKLLKNSDRGIDGATVETVRRALQRLSPQEPAKSPKGG
jgi:beta-lactamase regulating signal transducer with metallopeptidase domain/HEAT repeat protein